MSNKVLGIIPSRYGSSRFPGKPLAMIGDKPMIQHVYENCRKALSYVYVATDDERIFDAVQAFGGKVVMTSKNHANGTERCAEAAMLISAEENVNFDVIINIQGDEPFLDINQIHDLLRSFESRDTQIATLIHKIENKDDLFDIMNVKVAVNSENEAIYFSRSPIPFLRNVEKDEWLDNHSFYKHIGIYGFRPGVLLEVVKLMPSPLEKAESLEQLRWLENGYKVKCEISEVSETVSVDTPQDLERANEIYKQMTNGQS